MPVPRDLATILYRPRETMRRVLDSPGRWWWQIVIAAAVATSIGDTDMQRLRSAFPSLRLSWLMPIAFGAVVVVAITRVLLVWVFGWITAVVGRLLSGAAPTRDVRAALSWGFVPFIWASIYFAFEAIYKHELIPDARASGREIVMNALANGGCSFVVVALAVRVLICVWCVWIASGAVAEAQRFGFAKGFANVALAVIAPVAVIAAAVIATHV